MEPTQELPWAGPEIIGQLAAMRELLDRGYSRPPAGLEIDHGIGSAPLSEIMKYIAARKPFEGFPDPDGED